MVLYCAIITFLDDKQLQYKQPPKSTELTSYFLKNLKQNGHVWSEGVIRIESRNIKKYLRDIYVQVLHSIQSSLTIVSSLCTLCKFKEETDFVELCTLEAKAQPRQQTVCANA